jgi:cbb3-type cytochrome oxidase subunit 3
MEWSLWAYFGFTLVLGIIFLGIIIYYYTPKRMRKIEEPKYRMLKDDENE